MSKGPTLIVAMDEQRGIGKAGTLPWHLPEDLRHFRDTTLNHTVVMGHRTFHSIGRALPKRTNIVISRDGVDKFPPGVIVTNELRHALSLASRAPEQKVFVIGGASVYEQALGIASELIVTHVPGVYDCDRFFPEIDLTEWPSPQQYEIPSLTLDCKVCVKTYRR